MNYLSQILPINNIVLDLFVTSKKRALEQIGLLFENHHGLAYSVIFDSLFSREKLGSTGLGRGVAVPHGYVKGIKKAISAFIRLENPVNFNAQDGQPVNLLLCLLVPEHAMQQHLDILGEMAKIMSNENLMDALNKEIDPIVIHRMLINEKTDSI